MDRRSEYGMASERLGPEELKAKSDERKKVDIVLDQSPKVEDAPNEAKGGKRHVAQHIGRYATRW